MNAIEIDRYSNEFKGILLKANGRFHFFFFVSCVSENQQEFSIDPPTIYRWKTEKLFRWIFNGVMVKGHCTIFASLPYSVKLKRWNCNWKMGYCLHTFPFQIQPGATTQNREILFDLREERIAWKFLRTSVSCAPQSFLFIDNGYRWQPFGVHFVHFSSIIYVCAPTNYVPFSGGGRRRHHHRHSVVVSVLFGGMYIYYLVYGQRLVTHMHWICVHKRCRSRTQNCIHLLNYRVVYWRRAPLRWHS